MTRILVPMACVGLVLVARLYLAQPGGVPAGQPPLATVMTLDDLKAEFNRDASNMRALVLLAPSCPFCLKGASLVERLLDEHPSNALTLFVVWQPILPTDWAMPHRSSLNRLRDRRVHQLWDPDHQVARALQLASEMRKQKPDCCFSKGIWWDMMAVFPPGSTWAETLPEPVMLGGTVGDVAPAFEVLLRGSAGP